MDSAGSNSYGVARTISSVDGLPFSLDHNSTTGTRWEEADKILEMVATWDPLPLTSNSKAGSNASGFAPAAGVAPESSSAAVVELPVIT